MKVYLKSLLAVVMFVFSLAGEIAKAAIPSDTLSIATAAEFETLHPMIASQGATKYMLYLAWRPLVVLDEKLNWVPSIIKKVPSIENKLAKVKGGGMEVTFEILENISWGDDVPVTCKDIDFAWKIGKSVNVSNPNREPYENVTSVSWDPKTPKKCVINLAKKKFDFFYQLPDPMPAHKEEAIFDKYKDKPEGYDRNTLYVKEPTNPALWYGPYLVSEVKLGSHVIFTENPKWKGAKPSIKKIIFKLLPNNSTHVANMKSGNVQLFMPAASLGIDQAIAFEKEIKAQSLPYVAVYEDGLVYVHIDINLDHPALKELKVRQALNIAIDRNELITSLIGGKAKVANQPATDKDPWFSKKVPPIKYSLRDANKLLDEAGWKSGADGIREKDGKKLSFTINGGAGAKVVEMTETYLQDQYKKIGVQLLIKNEPARVLFGETIPHRQFDLAIYSWTSSPESSPRSTLHSSKIPTATNSWSGQNNPGWKNAEVDKLIDLLEEEMNAKKRAEYGRKINEIYAAEIPVIPLYYRQSNTVRPKDMKNYRLSGNIYYETLSAEKWSF